MKLADDPAGGDAMIRYYRRPLQERREGLIHTTMVLQALAELRVELEVIRLAVARIAQRLDGGA